MAHPLPQGATLMNHLPRGASVGKYSFTLVGCQYDEHWLGAINVAVGEQVLLMLYKAKWGSGFDPKAVKALYQQQSVGYLPKRHAGPFTDAYNNFGPLSVVAKVSHKTPEDGGGFKTITLEAAIYVEDPTHVQDVQDALRRAGIFRA